jgi:hypothetical protein
MGKKTSDGPPYTVTQGDYSTPGGYGNGCLQDIHIESTALRPVLMGETAKERHVSNPSAQS